ncbi:hypothetical protein [Dongshaea marina]
MPLPHIWYQNPKNGHAHLLYGLVLPITSHFDKC